MCQTNTRIYFKRSKEKTSVSAYKFYITGINGLLAKRTDWTSPGRMRVVELGRWKVGVWEGGGGGWVWLHMVN